MVLQRIQRCWHLIVNRSIAELRTEGTRTYAGYLWWIFEPLMSLAVYYVAFKYILHRDTENFAIFLFTGIVAYRFFAGTVNRCAATLSESGGLMQQVYVHKIIFPLSVVMVNLVKFMITLALVMITVWLAGIFPTISYLYLPLLIVMQLLIICGVSLLCAAITPFFPDFKLVLATALHLMLFLSGVVYDISILPTRIQSLIRLNPLAVLIEQYRDVLILGRWPEIQHLTPVLIQGVFLTLVGWWLINKFNRVYPKIS